MRASLVFDSDQVGMRLGTRGHDLDGRTLLFKAGVLCVDLMVHAGTGGMRLVRGQVLHQTRNTPLVGAEVRLGEGRESVETDEFGQFSVAALDCAGPQELCVTMLQAEMICVIPACEATAGG